MKYCDQCHSTYPGDFSTCPKDKSPLRKLTELAPGMVLREKYEILERIGTGGMATVYRARHTTFNEIKALKIVSNKLMDDEEFLRRFKTEAIITRKLHHQNAVLLEDFDTAADGRPFIVMEYVQGRSLRSWIHDLGSIPLQRALSIAKQVAAPLGAAHKLGIVHRDIKPDNIIVLPQASGTDVVKVFDFGIAKMRAGGGMESAGDHTPTKTGMVVGTPQYVSPEQASGKIGDQIDGRSDLYSLGVVLYEMLTGRLPFKSDTPMGYLLHHLQTPPTPPSALKPPTYVNESVTALLMKALAKDRDARFQSAEEMIAAFEKPYTVSPTAVLGSDATLHAPVRAAQHARAAAAPAPAPSPSSGRPAVQPWHAAAAGGTQPAVASTHTQMKAPGTVYQGPDETVWQGAAALNPPAEWKKWAAIAAVVFLIVLAIGYAFRRSAESRLAVQQQQVNASDQDAALKQAIEAEFADSDSLKDQKIDVGVQDANATLSGKVNKAYLSEIAGALARDVQGVKNVQNNIQVVEAAEAREPVWRSEAQRQQQAQTAQPTPAARPTTAADRRLLQAAVRQFVARGNRRLDSDDYRGAQRAFQNALRLDPTNRAAQEGLKRAQSVVGH